MIKEFKEFISRGNVIDLAVGVIMGSAFGKIVSSLVDDIIMPLVGGLIGGIDFNGLSVKIGESVISYGNFIQNIVDFLIIAICIFLIIKAINKLSRKKKAEPKEEVVVKAENTVLLEEIRDLLKKKK